MNIKQLQQGLSYCGKVEAVRQTYHVFQAKGAYLVLSFARSKDRKGSGYFNLIDEAAVDYVQGRMGGHSGVTAKDIVQAGRRTKHITGRLQALNILYVMVALNHAIAAAMVHGPPAGLALLASLDADARIRGH